MLDYIVVGMGLAGVSVCANLEEQGKSFKVFEDRSQRASLVAGGIFNPVMLKRFTLAWKAAEHSKTALAFYKSLEDKLQTQIFIPKRIYRKFHSAEEQNNWFSSADKKQLAPYLDTNIVKDLNDNITAEYSFGKVNGTGIIDTDALINGYLKYLDGKDEVRFEAFDHDALKVSEESVTYKGIEARKIIFCEGFGLSKNPYFNYLPFRGNKGEYIIISSEELELKSAIKSTFFILPLGSDLYKVGATYNNKDVTPESTQAAKEEICEHLEEILNCDYKVVDQVAGIRPTSGDRRPLVGQHPEFKNIFCCNGFGSRGILMAPTLGKQLIDLAEYETPLPSEIDIARFTRKRYQFS